MYLTGTLKKKNTNLNFFTSTVNYSHIINLNAKDTISNLGQYIYL